MKFSDLRRTASYRLSGPPARLLAKTPLAPNTLTWIGLVVSLSAAVAVGRGHLPLGGGLLLFVGAFDILDGAVARAKNQVTPFGALLDSTLDRLAEAAIFLGVVVFYLGEGSVREVLLANIALVASLMVSYVRARGEGLGLEGAVGIFTRDVRALVLALGLLLNQVPIALGAIALFGFVTAAQRFLHLRQQLRRQGD